MVAVNEGVDSLRVLGLHITGLNTGEILQGFAVAMRWVGSITCIRRGAFKGGGGQQGGAFAPKHNACSWKLYILNSCYEKPVIVCPPPLKHTFLHVHTALYTV